MRTVFQLKRVCAGYGSKTVLQDVDLEVQKGEFLGLIGPNGAGKSTLLKVMGGLLEPCGGSLQLMGRPLAEYGGKELARNLSMVQQYLGETSSFTVRDFVRLGHFPHQGLLEFSSKTGESAMAGALEKTGIPHLAARPLNELSGGERQLASIARALVQNSGLILLDEPVTHLDLSHSLQIMDVLHGLNDQGSTVIAVLHDINAASEYCSRIVALKEGTLFGQGTPEEIIRYDFIERLFGAVCISADNPVSGKPFIYPVPSHVRDKRKP